MILNVGLGERAYDIVIERGCLHQAGKLCNLNRKALVVTDSGVPAHYARAVADQCAEALIFTAEQGEESKSLRVFGEIMQALVEAQFTRADCVVAVGGGVVGDLAGFAAACYMRGIDFYNIPTTVLAQVDSSIGGKTAINLGGYKNMVGAFYQPKKVLIDLDVLNTLPRRQIANGLAEAVKMALTSDAQLFALFEEAARAQDAYAALEPLMETVIERSLRVKKHVVEQDEREAGLRKILNFGHTIGHGIEAYEQHRLAGADDAGTDNAASQGAGASVKRNEGCEASEWSFADAPAHSCTKAKRGVEDGMASAKHDVEGLRSEASQPSLHPSTSCSPCSAEQHAVNETPTHHDAREEGLYHGECVALGMIPLCSPAVRARLIPVLAALGLPTTCAFDANAVVEAIKHDKKSIESKVTIITVPEVGTFAVEQSTPEALKPLLPLIQARKSNNAAAASAKRNEGHEGAGVKHSEGCEASERSFANAPASVERNEGCEASEWSSADAGARILEPGRESAGVKRSEGCEASERNFAPAPAKEDSAVACTLSSAAGATKEGA